MSERKILILSSLCGTTLEWYDFSLFGALAPLLSELFFPNENALTSLLQTFSVFAMGFLMRPLGALFWGYLGDKIGRRKTIIQIITMMTGSTLMISLLPTYATIGSLAPLLLLFCRLLQGFSASGEHAGMLTYLYEKSFLQDQGRLASLSIVGVYFGMGLGVFSGLLIHSSMSHDSIIRWGWRIPFACSVFLGMIGVWIRQSLSESLIFVKIKKLNSALTISTWMRMLFKNSKLMICGVGLFQLAVIVPYIVFVYLLVFLTKAHQFNGQIVYLITFINLILTGVAVYLFSKMASIHYKKQNLLILISILGLMIGAFSMYRLFFSGIAISIFVGQLYFGLLTAMLAGSLSIKLAQWFSVQIRYSAVAICFNMAATIFGGTAPVMLTLFHRSPNPLLSVGIYITLSALLALLSLWWSMKKTSEKQYVSIKA